MEQKGNEWVRKWASRSSDLLVTSSSNWFSLAVQCVCHCQHRLISHFPEESRAGVCVCVPLTETETDGPTPTGYMCLLSFGMLCQEVWTCMPLRVMLAPKQPLGLLVQNPSLLFPWNWHTGVTVVAQESNGDVQGAHTLKGKHPFVPHIPVSLPLWILAAQFTHHPQNLSKNAHWPKCSDSPINQKAMTSVPWVNEGKTALCSSEIPV